MELGGQTQIPVVSTQLFSVPGEQSQSALIRKAESEVVVNPSVEPRHLNVESPSPDGATDP